MWPRREEKHNTFPPTACVMSCRCLEEMLFWNGNINAQFLRPDIRYGLQDKSHIHVSSCQRAEVW